MNVNLKNLSNMISKQDSVNQTKNNGVEKSSNSFEKSLEDSLNVTETGKNSLSKINSKETDIKQTNINDEESESLEEIVYLLDLMGILNVNYEENIFNFQENLNMISDYSENLSGNDINAIGYFNENNINENSLSKILYEIGCDKDKVDARTISNGEVIQNILDNSDSFKGLIMNEISKFEDDNFVSNITKFLNDKNFLGSEDLLNNVKNEMSNKINEMMGKELGEGNQNKIFEINNFNSPNIIRSNEKNADNILKEISGELNINQNIENYIVDTFRNNDLSNQIFDKPIDTSNPVKFAGEFIEAIEYMSTNNKSEMIVKLNPEHLGRMDIKYEFVKDNVRLMIKVENSETLKLMDTVLADIKNMIRDNHQVNLENIHVDLQQFEFNSNDHNSNQNNNNQSDKNNNKNSIKLEDEEIVKDKRDLRSGILV